MSTQHRIGIVGYGNLGRGVEQALARVQDMELVGVFSRRAPESMQSVFPDTQFFSIDDLSHFEDSIDVLILCGGSKSDLPVQGPELAARFNTVDSFDTHARIPEYFSSINKAAVQGNKLALISTGWDPGLFSLNRVLGEALLPDGITQTFWGPGLSQGHSDAIRRVPGVAAGVQYTIPADDVLAAIRAGETPELTAAQKHHRECFVVLHEGADADQVRQDIVTMPDYFAEYNTTVNFISAEELAENHAAMPHGGTVIRSGKTGTDNTVQRVEFQLALGSNPEFTASVLTTYARAVARMAATGMTGAITVFDIPFRQLSEKSYEELLRDYL